MEFINVLNNKKVYADGIHDDTAALQECLDQMKNGGTIYFPDGTYLISEALIFYSCQTLKLSDNAVILRSDKSEEITRYLLASYSEPEWGAYNGTHDVVISGGIFDANKNTAEKTTVINTVHCRNITIEACRFRHCSRWHFIEINSSENVLIQGCIFDGPSYTYIPEELLNEMIQLDRARDGSYGPVFNAEHKLIDFCKDDTVCRNITIKNNIFKCAGFPAIGHHDDCAHSNIEITDNIFDGFSGKFGKSRGYIIFRPQVCGIKISHNVFMSKDKYDSPNIGIITENPDKSTSEINDNIFTGHFD